MQVNTLQNINQNYFVEEKGVLIEILVPRHLNEDEAQAASMRLSKSLVSKPLDYYTNSKNLTETEQRYAYKLAYYGRIQLKPSVQTAPIQASKFNILNLETFQLLEKLFDEKFTEYSLANNIKLSPTVFKKKLNNELLKLWFRGYGLLPGHNVYAINDDILNELFSHKDKRHLSRFVSFILKDIDVSKVNIELPNPKTVNKNHLMSSDESELGKWKVILQEETSPLTEDLYEFLKFLEQQANGTITKFITNKDGNQIKKSYPQIKWGNFNLKSSNLRKAVPMLKSLGVVNIEQILNEYSLITLYASEEFQALSVNQQQNIRNTLRGFVKYYCEANAIQINIERIAPSTTTNRITTYSENINFGETAILIDALFDDSNSLIDEKDTYQAKVRRALLLQIATGARIHEILLLKSDCLFTNSSGETFIYFHKTKMNLRDHYVKVDSDITEWIKELQSISDTTPIEVDSKNTSTTFGDDLNVPRLFVNSTSTNIILPSSINRFLKRLTCNLKLKSRFSTHDMRKIHALYLKMKGKDKVDIQFALNQTDIDSQLPYLATKTNKVVENLKELSLEGVWSHITDAQKNDSDIPLDTVLNRASSFQSSADSKKKAAEFLENIFMEVSEQNKQLPVHNENSPSNGMPMYSHNCTAAVVVNCGHTELDCFSCNKYLPDQDKLMEHKAEVLRYMIQVFFYEAEAKKDKLEQDSILVNSKEIKNKLQSTFNSLFYKFNLGKSEALKLEKSLNSIAKKHWKTNKSLISHTEALKVLLKEE